MSTPRKYDDVYRMLITAGLQHTEARQITLDVVQPTWSYPRLGCTRLPSPNSTPNTNADRTRIIDFASK